MLVWAHHMFATPTATVILAFFMLGSMLIAIPTGVKIFNWIATLWRGSIVTTTALYFAVGFIALFVIGGISGVMLAIFPIDWQLHDTYFVVAHFHYVLVAGAVNAIIAGLYYWFPKMTGRMMSESLGKVSFWLTFIGFNVTFLVQHSLGLSGMPRRIYEYAAANDWGTYNLISTIGSFILAVGVALTAYNVVRSLRKGAVGRARPVEGQHARVVHHLAAAGQQLRRRPARALGRADEGHPPPGGAGARPATPAARRSGARRAGLTPRATPPPPAVTPLVRSGARAAGRPTTSS